MPVEDLDFRAYELEEGRWVIPQGLCYMCGCDTDFIEFDDEFDATTTAYMLNVNEHENEEYMIEMDMCNLCPSCREHFIKCKP
ncbi:hypothetical protein D3C74_102290 [compost metagenome]